MARLISNKTAHDHEILTNEPDCSTLRTEETSKSVETIWSDHRTVSEFDRFCEPALCHVKHNGFCKWSSLAHNIFSVLFILIDILLHLVSCWMFLFLFLFCKQITAEYDNSNIAWLYLIYIYYNNKYISLCCTSKRMSCKYFRFQSSKMAWSVCVCVCVRVREHRWMGAWEEKKKAIHIEWIFYSHGEVHSNACRAVTCAWA